VTQNGVWERFPNLTPAGVSNVRPMSRQERVQVAGPFSEFWAKGTGASKIESLFLTLFPPDPSGTGETTRSLCQSEHRSGSR
jgi:hypothetical protein